MPFCERKDPSPIHCTVRPFFKHLSPSTTGGTSILNGLVILLGMGSGITMARSLGPVGRGILAAAILWPGILQLFADFGLGFAFAFHAGKGKHGLDALCTSAVLLGGSLGCLLAGVGFWTLPHWVPILGAEASRAFRIALWSVPVITINGYQAYLLLGARFIKEYNLIKTSTAVANLVSTLVVAFWGGGVNRFSWAFVLTQIVGLAFSSAMIVFRFRPRVKLDFKLIRELFSYGARDQLASIAGQTNLRADQAIMSAALNPSQLGLYAVAVPVSGILSPFLNAVAVMVLPGTVQVEGVQAGAMVAVRHIKRAIVLSIPVLAASILLMPFLLPALFGASYAPAVRCAQVLLIAGLFQGINAVLGNGLRGIGKPGCPALAEGIGVIVTLSLLKAFLPSLGILGAALASLAAYCSVAGVQLFLLARMAGLDARRLIDMPIDLPLLRKTTGQTG